MSRLQRLATVVAKLTTAGERAATRHPTQAWELLKGAHATYYCTNKGGVAPTRITEIRDAFAAVYERLSGTEVMSMCDLGAYLDEAKCVSDKEFQVKVPAGAVGVIRNAHPDVIGWCVVCFTLKDTQMFSPIAPEHVRIYKKNGEPHR